MNEIPTPAPADSSKERRWSASDVQVAFEAVAKKPPLVIGRLNDAIEDAQTVYGHNPRAAKVAGQLAELQTSLTEVLAKAGATLEELLPELPPEVFKQLSSPIPIGTGTGLKRQADVFRRPTGVLPSRQPAESDTETKPTRIVRPSSLRKREGRRKESKEPKPITAEQQATLDQIEEGKLVDIQFFRKVLPNGISNFALYSRVNNAILSGRERVDLSGITKPRIGRTQKLFFTKDAVREILQYLNIDPLSPRRPQRKRDSEYLY